ncbi:MAG TPA: DUF3093 domain-containing protein [Kineosporiaceae bacterium]|nr:DUF3093 domain-containing protein [Kineosporiaceae bacterium]
MEDGYRERLWPAWWLWPLVVALGAGFGLVVAPYGAVPAVVVTVVMTGVLAVLLLSWTATVGLDGDLFVAGRARIPVRLLGTPEVLDAAGMQHARGPGLDARAYLCLRGWIGPGLRVPVVDPEDPVPYWLVSSRRPGELADALHCAGASGSR